METAIQTPSTDGRRRRSEQSRDRIVTAMMALIADGAISPSAEDVATRANVGLRSVFRHFNDMESLYAEMSMQLARGYESALAPFESQGWQDQLFEAIGRRLTVYERLLPFKRAADAHRHESPTIQAVHDGITEMLRARLRLLMPPHLADDSLAFETLDLLLSIETWARLRRDQKLAPEIARIIIESQVRRLAAG